MGTRHFTAQREFIDYPIAICCAWCHTYVLRYYRELGDYVALLFKRQNKRSGHVFFSFCFYTWEFCCRNRIAFIMVKMSMKATTFLQLAFFKVSYPNNFSKITFKENQGMLRYVKECPRKQRNTYQGTPRNTMEG